MTTPFYPKVLPRLAPSMGQDGATWVKLINVNITTSYIVFLTFFASNM